MRPGDFSPSIFIRSSKTAITWIVFTLASFSSARSLVEHRAETPFIPTAATCPGDDVRLSRAADNEFDSILAQTPSTSMASGSIATELKVLKEFRPGIRLVDRPGILRVLDKTFEKIDLTPQSATLANCMDSICVLKTFLGSEEAAKRLITISLRTGFTVSFSPEMTTNYQEKVTVNGVETLRTKKTSSIWTLAELRKLSEASKVIARIRLKIGSPLTLYRTGYSSKFAAEASSLNWIRFYNDAFENGDGPWDGAENAAWSDKVFVHEYCHILDYQARDEDRSLAYRSLMPKYQPRTGLKWGERGVGEEFITPYSQTSHAEDFADSCAYFILAPKVLLARAPHKYAAMKDILFGGRDFNAEQWNAPLFPEIANLFSNSNTEERCTSALIKNTNDLILHADGRAQEIVSRSATSITTMTHSRWGITSIALKNAREDIIQDALREVSDSPTFCDRGGETALRLRSTRVCAATQAKTARLEKPFSDEKITALARECVTQEKNLTSTCVDGKIGSLLRAETSDPLITALSTRYQTAPISTAVQSEALKVIGPQDWLLRCLVPINNASNATGLITYNLKGPVLTGQGTLRVQGSPASLNSVQNSCLSEVRVMLRDRGYKLPIWTASESTSLYPTLPGLEPILASFEDKLLGPVMRDMCPAGGTCTDDKVKTATLAWIGQDARTTPISSSVLSDVVKRLATRVK